MHSWSLCRLKAQHTLKRNACRDSDLLGDSDAIQNLSSLECLEQPCEIARVNAIHRRARADDRVEAEDRLFGMFICEPLHHVDFSSYCENRTCGRRLNALPDHVC